eukprot:8507907-Karenia_brevis.AAC.1
MACARTLEDAKQSNLDIIKLSLERLGYACGHFVTNTLDYALPQRRKRVYFWAEFMGHNAKLLNAWRSGYLEYAKSPQPYSLAEVLGRQASLGIELADI